jgi:hypothetical protein
LSVVVSGHTTIILIMTWNVWPFQALDVVLLTDLVVNALDALGASAWGPRRLREDAVREHCWTLQDVRWRAETRAWHRPWAERRRPRREGRVP